MKTMTERDLLKRIDFLAVAGAGHNLRQVNRSQAGVSLPWS